MIDKSVGQRLSQARMRAGLSVKQVGKLHGTDDGDITDWLRNAETGEVPISDDDIEGLSKIYGVDSRWIRTGESSIGWDDIEKALGRMGRDDLEKVSRLLISLIRED